jgi:ABC-type nickel/cobalt efflux system permease component RcnA
MDSLFVLFALFGVGVLHGLGPDHLAAIAALAGQGTGRQVERRELALLGLRFGIGHVSTLVLLAVVVWALGRNLPDAWQRGLEQLGGAVLIFLGGWILAEVWRRRVLVHSHTHEHKQGAESEPHEHLHIHLHGRPHTAHRHPHLATLVGGLMGFSGARALLIALPVVVAGSVASVTLRVVAFGAGIVVSMTLAGFVAQAAFGRVARTPGYARLVVALTGVLSTALGVYWLASFGAK